MRSVYHLFKRVIPNCVSPYALDVYQNYLKATSWMRALPNFVIIGAQKSGTSSLYFYLSQHPQIHSSYNKEVHYFDGGLDPGVDDFVKGVSWYRSHFPIRRSSSENIKIFEASPLYIFNPLAPGRIFDLMPQVKIIALLRNPTERAISQYFHERRYNRESLSMIDAFMEEKKRLSFVLEKKDYKNEEFIHHSYKSRGLYKQQIERYLNYFSMDQVLLMGSEKFFSEPEVYLKQIYDFVGVRTEYKIKDLTPRNVTSNKKYVDPEIYDYLDNYFLPHNQALYEMVGEDFGW